MTSLSGRRQRLLEAEATEAGAWRARSSSLRVDDDEDCHRMVVERRTGSRLREPRPPNSTRLVELLDDIRVDTKAEALLGQPRVIFEHDPNAEGADLHRVPRDPELPAATASAERAGTSTCSTGS